MDTLEAALWAVQRTTNFEDALVLAVNLGGDATRSVRSPAKSPGARYGLSGIPRRWLAPLAWYGRLEAVASDLMRMHTP